MLFAYSIAQRKEKEVSTTVFAAMIENPVTCNPDEATRLKIKFVSRIFLSNVESLSVSLARDRCRKVDARTISHRGHVIHIERATAGAYVCLLYHDSLTWLISLLVQP